MVSDIGLRSIDIAPCELENDGWCRQGVNTIDVCASGTWQSLPQGSYRCDGHQIIPIIETQAQSLSTAPTASLAVDNIKAVSKTINVTTADDKSPKPGSVGYFVCTNTTLVPRLGNDAPGWATYRPGGKMASVYDAPRDGPFRCDIDPAPDNYVALWTQYDAKLTSQPPPLNCGAFIKLRNPKNNVSAEAQIIDRCASCVGVGRQTSDPTTPDVFVNGATIDLSRNLWNILYDHGANNTYDIEYDGDIYPGWHTPPSPMVDPRCD